MTSLFLDTLFTTVGCHPTRCGEFEAKNDPVLYYNELLKVFNENRNKIVAIGECGLGKFSLLGELRILLI